MTSSNESEKQITELQQENELLLLQLHQVQEELEHYFLLYRDCEAKNQKLVPTIQHRGENWPLFVERLPKNLARILKRTTFVRKSILRHSGFFDEAWYLKTYPDVAEKRRDPVEHYLRHGAREGRNPGPQFDTRWYLGTNQDVAEKGVNPLWHYVQFGRCEGRVPRPGGIMPPPDPFENERKRLTQARNEQTRLASERQRRIEQLTQANEIVKKQAKEQQELIAHLTQEREQFARQQDNIQAELEQLVQARDMQMKLADERLQQIEQLTAAKTEAEQQVSGLQDQLAVLAQKLDESMLANVEAEKQVKALQAKIAELTQIKDEQTKLAMDRQQHIKKLEDQLADVSSRQVLLNEEMIKAEAQIELIKDLLLGESVL